VSLRRSVVCVVAACPIAAIAIACSVSAASAARVAPRAQDWQGDPCALERLETIIKQEGWRSCRPRMHPEEGLLRGELRGDFLHFRVGYVGKVAPLHKAAFKAGMAMWNRHSHITGFVFEEAASLEDADFRLEAGAPAMPPNAKEDEPIEETSCAGYRTDGSHIWYSTTNTNWLMRDTDIPDAARIYAHELGHGLNLDHKTFGSSVMHQGDAGSDCRDLASVIIADVQESDANDAHRCGCAIRLKARGQDPTPQSLP
jgi:hypothetical protein